MDNIYEYYCNFQQAHIGDKFALKGYDFEKISDKKGKVLINDEYEGNVIEIDFDTRIYIYELF